MTLDRLHRTYADVPPGEPVAYVGSAGTLEIGLDQGSFKERYGLNVEDGVVVKKNAHNNDIRIIRS